MNINKSIWTDEEVKTLFKFVEIKKDEGVPLIKIFAQFGERVQRCQNSVRNYYYEEITRLNTDKIRSQKLGIDLSLHVSKKHKEFSDEEFKNLIERLTTLINNGYSVRKACLTLADGDANLMIRYQNKYRSYLKQKGEKESVENVIQMPVKRNIMSDEDIKALFMGILKLVKKQEAQNAKDFYEGELLTANQKLKNAVAEIVLKSNKIENLQNKITLLQEEIKQTRQQLILKRVKSVQSSSAGKLLKEFMGKQKQHFSVANAKQA